MSPPLQYLFYLLNGVILRGVVYYDDIKAGIFHLIYRFEAFYCILPVIPVENDYRNFLMHDTLTGTGVCAANKSLCFDGVPNAE